MSASSLVSVLIRTKDRKTLLLEAVQSVLLQTHTPLDILIVNDGGADHSADLPVVNADSGRTLHWLDNQGSGRSAAANTALLAARGRYCLFLDDDDWLDPAHIGNLVQALDATPACLLAYSATRTVMADGSIGVETFDHPFDATRLLTENYIPIHAALFSRALVELGCRFDTNYDRYEDWDFWLQALQHSDFLYIPACTANYRVTQGSGFGVRPETDQQYRLALIRKWLPRWTDAQVLAVIDRSRSFPLLAPLREELADQLRFVALLQEQEATMTRELGLRATALHKQTTLLGEASTRLQVAEQERLDTENSLQQTQAQLNAEKQLVTALKNDLNTIYNSRSWKLTRPLRLYTKVRYFLRNEGLVSVLRRAHFKLFRRVPQLPVVQANHPLAQGYHALEFPVHERPLISIVIPVYNKYEYTFHCLKSVLANSSDQSYEVIVVDDCSSDATPKMLAGIAGITVIRNEKNSGFIYSCNAGAQAAKGEYLLLFNNDTEPQPRWLSALVDTFREFPDAGMVGAKLLYPDGVLQEAGGIVWRDGSAWNYGRNDDPNKPEYSWCREVDYCSGACLILPLADFMALGMFDSHYAPAYYEDTDLAFKVRAAGKKVYYQPLARVIHFEGVSNGTDLNAGIKEYQVANHRKFFARWEETLRSHRPNARLPQLEKERNVHKRVLVIDARVLMPDHDSGSLRMFNLLKVFRKLDYKVSFIPDNLHYHKKYTPLMQAIGIECLYLPYVTSISEHLEHFGSQYQVVLLSRADVAEKNIDAVVQYCPQAAILYDTVDLHFLRERRLAELNHDKAQMASAAMRKLQELSIARKAHTTLVVSPVEVELFRQEAPDVQVALLSNIHAAEGRKQGYVERRDILFIGSFEHPPNVDAMHFFIDEVFPLLHRQKPDIKVLIVGSNAPKNLLAKAGSHLEFTGFVADIAPLFNRIRLSIAPLRYGAGVKGKINSSMAYGVPVIASTVAAEGMDLVHEHDVLIADDAAGFASQIVRAYDDENLWYALSDAGLANIERCFSFELAVQQLRAILGTVSGGLNPDN